MADFLAKFWKHQLQYSRMTSHLLHHICLVSRRWIDASKLSSISINNFILICNQNFDVEQSKNNNELQPDCFKNNSKQLALCKWNFNFTSSSGLLFIVVIRKIKIRKNLGTFLCTVSKIKGVSECLLRGHSWML